MLYSTEVKIFKSSEVISRQQLLDIKEGVEGAEESQFTLVIPPSGSETVPLGGITLARLLIINAKPKGGNTDVDLVARITNDVTGTTGIAATAQDLRLGSYLILLDTKLAGLSITNLNPLSSVDVQVFILGV